MTMLRSRFNDCWNWIRLSSSTSGIEEISGFLDLCSPFNIELVPNGNACRNDTLFGLMEFVKEVSNLEYTGAENGKPRTCQDQMCRLGSR